MSHWWVIVESWVLVGGAKMLFWGWIHNKWPFVLASVFESLCVKRVWELQWCLWLFTPHSHLQTQILEMQQNTIYSELKLKKHNGAAHCDSDSEVQLKFVQICTKLFSTPIAFVKEHWRQSWLWSMVTPLPMTKLWQATRTTRKTKPEWTMLLYASIVSAWKISHTPASFTHCLYIKTQTLETTLCP